MESPDSPGKAGGAEQPEKTFDTLINDLIAQRKLQQEALAKIKASVERGKPGQKPSGSRPKSTSN